MACPWSQASVCLANNHICLTSQIGIRDLLLDILIHQGLRRTQQGALIVTVHDAPEELDLEAIGAMPLSEMAKLYTVKPQFQLLCSSNHSAFYLAMHLPHCVCYRLLT